MSLLHSISQKLPLLGAWLAAGGRFAEPRQKILKVLAGLVMIYGLNKTFNAIARNHWQIRKAGVPWNLDEETAVVTGGCSGFGLLTTKGLARKIRKVIVLDISDLPEELKGISNVAYYKCDITSPEAVKETGAEIRRAHGKVSILINNAGIATSHTIQDTTPEYLEKIFKINVFSHWYLINEFLPSMLEAKKGHILALASMASYSSTANLVDYSATKHAVLALHDGLNSELKYRYTNGRCIQTSIVHPMWARTPLIDSWSKTLVRNKAPVLEPRQVADAVVQQILSGRAGQIFLPSVFSIASGVHGWPNWLQEFLRDGNAPMTDIR